MDYRQACARLDGPRAQHSKKLGHKLTLYYDGKSAVDVMAPDETGQMVETEKYEWDVHLQYFDTNILTWYVDGSVRIRTGSFWDSRFTLDKLNEFSPRGWRMNLHRLRFSPRIVCASLTARSDTWDFLWSSPYEDQALYDQEGRRDHRGSPLAAVEACHILNDVAETAKETTMAFLYGQLPKPDAEVDLCYLDGGVAGNTIKRSQLIIDITRAKKASASLIWAVIQNEWSNSFRMNQLELYDPAMYPFTGRPRTQKGRTVQMEHFLRVGNDRVRYTKNSEEFHAMKRDLMAECEMYLVRELGFETKEFERRPRTPW